MLKSKAVSLAKLGESVTYIFLGERRDMEAVMTVATRIQMTQYPTITVLSLPNLVTYHRNHSSHTRLSLFLPTPSALTLLQFYLTMEKPNNVFIDKVPLETQWDIIRWPANALLTYSPLTGTVWIIFAVAAPISAFFLACLASEQMLASHGKEISNLHPVLLQLLAPHVSPWSLLPLTLLILWLAAGHWLPPYSLASTRSLLVSLPSLLPPSATLWIALHSAPLTDITQSGGNILRDALEEWRRSLAPTFSSPRLRCNLRNTPQITKVKNGWSMGMMGGQSKALTTAEPPPAAPSLHPSPSTSPIFLPLSSPSQLQAAVAHTLSLLSTTSPLVILMENPAHQQQVEAALTKGNIQPFIYLTPIPSNLNACTAFLSRPRGALITSGELFSGMEAVSVVVITRREGGRRVMERSDMLRAIERLVIIDTDTIDLTVSRGTVLDSRFTSCHLHWAAKVYRCTSCPSTPFICPHCRMVCHQHCQTDDCILPFYTFYHSTILNLNIRLPVTSCSCHTSNKCKFRRANP